MRAINTMIEVITSLIPAARTNGTANGTGVDLANVGAVMVTFVVGTVTDGTHVPKLQDSADNSAWADVAAADQVGTLGNLATNTNQEVGYIGSKRYVRPVITTTGATTGAVAGAVAVRANGRKQPI